MIKNVAVGGYVPYGKRLPSGSIEDIKEFVDCIGYNLKEAEGLLVLYCTTIGDRGGTNATIKRANQLKKPLICVDLNEIKFDDEDNQASLRNRSLEIIKWMDDNNVYKLFVAGPRESKAPGVYFKAKEMVTHLIDTIERTRE